MRYETDHIFYFDEIYTHGDKDMILYLLDSEEFGEPKRAGDFTDEEKVRYVNELLVRRSRVAEAKGSDEYDRAKAKGRTYRSVHQRRSGWH